MMDIITLLMLEFYDTDDGLLTCFIGKRYDGAIVTSFSETFNPYDIRCPAPSPSQLIWDAGPPSPEMMHFAPRPLSPPRTPGPPLQDWFVAPLGSCQWAPHIPVAKPSAKIVIKSPLECSTVLPVAEPMLLPRGFDAGHSCNPVGFLLYSQDPELTLQIFFPESPIIYRPSEEALRVEFDIRLFDATECNYDVKRPLLRYTPPIDPPAMAELVALFDVDHWALHPLWSDPEQEKWRAEWTAIMSDPLGGHMHVDDACQLDCSDYWPEPNQRCVSAPAYLKGYDYSGEAAVNMTLRESMWGSPSFEAAMAQWTSDTAAASMSEGEWIAPPPPKVLHNPKEISYASI